MNLGKCINRMDVDFEKVSKSYDEVHGQTVDAIHKFSQDNYYLRCQGAKVLDIGNGGQPAAEVLGENVSKRVSCFVGVDNSIDMMKRKKCHFIRVIGDGICLPFKDKAFDYVLINGVFHHLGYLSKEDQVERISYFLIEARRVCAQEIIVYELLVPPWIEKAEKLFASILGYMPVFVLSYKTLNSIVEKNGMSCGEVCEKTLSDLMGTFYWYPLMMAYEWLKVPAFISPFKHTFFVISS